MAPKGKQATKGQKQILQENQETLRFYRYMALGALGCYLLLIFIVFTNFSTWDKIFFGVSIATYGCCYKFMSSMATPNIGSSGVMLDEGCDLNIEGGIAEHVKDLIILTTGCLGLSSFSCYFWLLWLLAPARAFQMIWSNILSPYIFQEAPPEESAEAAEKKQRKIYKTYNRR